LSKTRPSLLPPVAEALRTLGADLRNARLRRRIPMTYAADRALISRSTLHKVERGDPAVGLGIYATVLFYYGMIERLEHLMDVRRDWIAIGLDEERLPRRVRRQKRDASSLTSAADQAFANRWSTAAASADFPCALKAAASPNSDHPFSGNRFRSSR
jgi:hypothetical protein